MKNNQVGQVLLALLVVLASGHITHCQGIPLDSHILQRSVLFRRVRSASDRGNVSEPVVKKYAIVRRPGPAKRDFQDHNPPRTPKELYERYDPSVAVSTGVALGGLLGFIIGRVMFRVVVKMAKKQLRKTKRFGKYFPERELPPLHVAQQIAREHGIALPESLIIKLMKSVPDANLKHIADVSKSPAAIAAAAISPLILQENQQSMLGQGGRSISPSGGELLGLIRVNIIGATPSITPNASHKLLPELDIHQKPPQTLLKSSSASKLKSKKDENGHVGSDGRTVVTTATIEMQPLLLSTSLSGKNASFSGGLHANFSNNLSTGNKSMPSVHRSLSGRTVSTSSYCLTNGGAIMNSGALDRRRLMED